jgi:hypothetical protein
MFLTNKIFHYKLNNFSNMRRHGGVIAVHLVNDNFQDISHSLQNSVFHLLHVAFDFFLLV